MTFALWFLLAQQDLLHISDTHVASFAGVHADLAQARNTNAKSHERLDEFVAAVNRLPRKATVVHTGDAVDAVCFDGANGAPVYGQIELLRRGLRPLKHKLHLALGNHDVECYRRNAATPGKAVGDQSVAAEVRKRWRKRSYYATSIGRYRLILLDNGQAFESGGRPYFTRQMEWLTRELAKRPKTPTVIALHIPLTADERSTMVLDVLREAGQVKLVLCGHRHSDSLDWLTLGERKLLQVRTAALFQSASHWRRIRLWPDRLEVSATGEPERILATVR